VIGLGQPLLGHAVGVKKEEDELEGRHAAE
jgi:hypothetical protein